MTQTPPNSNARGTTTRSRSRKQDFGSRTTTMTNKSKRRDQAQQRQLKRPSTKLFRCTCTCQPDYNKVEMEYLRIFNEPKKRRVIPPELQKIYDETDNELQELLLTDDVLKLISEDSSSCVNRLYHDEPYEEDDIARDITVFTSVVKPHQPEVNQDVEVVEEDNDDEEGYRLVIEESFVRPNDDNEDRLFIDESFVGHHDDNEDRLVIDEGFVRQDDDDDDRLVIDESFVSHHDDDDEEQISKNTEEKRKTTDGSSIEDSVIISEKQPSVENDTTDEGLILGGIRFATNIYETQNSQNEVESVEEIVIIDDSPSRDLFSPIKKGANVLESVRCPATFINQQQGRPCTNGTIIRNDNQSIIQLQIETTAMSNGASTPVGLSTGTEPSKSIDPRCGLVPLAFEVPDPLNKGVNREIQKMTSNSVSQPQVPPTQPAISPSPVAPYSSSTLQKSKNVNLRSCEDCDYVSHKELLNEPTVVGNVHHDRNSCSHPQFTSSNDAAMTNNLRKLNVDGVGVSSPASANRQAQSHKDRLEAFPQCGVCYKFFNDFSGFQNHLNICHYSLRRRVDFLTYKCLLCRITFEDTFTLTRHAETCNGSSFSSIGKDVISKNAVSVSKPNQGFLKSVQQKAKSLKRISDPKLSRITNVHTQTIK